jgi:SAM-dependent methyltransferase
VPLSSSAVWQDVECGGYAADLDAWERLAADLAGPILELGCGTGRVCLRLARLGHEVWGVDIDAELIEALEARAAAEELAVHAVRADAAELDLDRRFGLVIAAMQFIQMIGDEHARGRVLRRAADRLGPGGRLGMAILDGPPEDLRGAPAPLPDVREVEGRVYSSLPVDVVSEGPRLELHRLRQEVAPDGAMSESEHAEALWLVDADALEREGEAAGLRPAERVPVPAMDGYVGSVIVVLERP